MNRTKSSDGSNGDSRRWPARTLSQRGGAQGIWNAHYALATGYQQKATAWSCQYVGPTAQWVVTKSDNTSWQFCLNGGGGDSDGWKSPAAYYVGTIKIDRK